MTRITLSNGEGRMQAFEFLTIEDEMTTIDSLTEIPTVVG